MKRIIVLFIISIVLFLLAYMVWRIVGRLEAKKEVAAYTATLPKTTFRAINSAEKRLEIKNEQPSILFFFNTECEHCQAEAQLVEKEIAQLQGANLYFFSIEPLEKIQAFAKTYRLDGLPNLSVGQLTAKEVSEKFGVRGFPSTFIYSPNGKLLQQFRGEVSIEAIKKCI